MGIGNKKHINGNDFRGSGNVENRPMVQKFKFLLSDLYHIIRVAYLYF